MRLHNVIKSLGIRYDGGIGGVITAPISVSLTRFLKWPRFDGVSRTARTSLRVSLSATSPVRGIRFEARPNAIEDSVCVEQRTTVIASNKNEPLAIMAPIRWIECRSWTICRTSPGLRPVS